MDLLARLHARIDAHSPGRVLVLVRNGAQGRWLQSSLVERSALVGVRILDLERLLGEAATDLAGAELPQVEVLAEVGRALVGELRVLADHPSYQRELFTVFVELERAFVAGGLDEAAVIDGCEPGSRDHAVLEAFVRFRTRMHELTQHSGWWRGGALARVLEGHARVAWLRRRAAAIAIGFEADDVASWQRTLISGLEFESWSSPDREDNSASADARLELRLECAGPEAEIAAVARMLRTGGDGAAVLAPTELIGRWVARLGHRDIPVRAWVSRSARSTAAARVTRTLLRLAHLPLVRRADLDALLFGVALRPWAADVEYSPALVRRVQQRWHAAPLDSLIERTRSGSGPITRVLVRLAQWRANPTPSELRTLLDDWELHTRASVGPEAVAARTIDEVLARFELDADPPPLANLELAIDHGLTSAGAGEWIETKAERGGPPVWVLPYEAVLDRLPPRVFMTGLDRHPMPPRLSSLSDSLCERIGLVGQARRFTAELRRLDGLLGHDPARVVASYRRSDGAGADVQPGPWIAARQHEGRVIAIGGDAIAVAVDGRALAPIEHDILDWAQVDSLARRVRAIASHESPIPGPHTGVLGVAIPPLVYSASALQSYSLVPFRYFVERVLGVSQRDDPAGGPGALAAHEQGQVVHEAIDHALAAALGATTGPIDLAAGSAELLAAAREALAAGYRVRAGQGQAEPLWIAERDRWAVELSNWWGSWANRLGRDGGPGDVSRYTEADVLRPGPYLIASEWATPEGFQLDLGPRVIGFSAAVDRIEFDPRRQRLDIVDYKTGSAPWPKALWSEFRAGTHLQLGLYALVVAQAVAREPAQFRLPDPIPVGALRLEYLKRPPRQGTQRDVKSVVRGAGPFDPVGRDADGVVWSLVHAAAGFTLAFVVGIESGHFPVVSRTPLGSRMPPSLRRIAEVARVIPGLDRRQTGLPDVLQPLEGVR